MYKTSAMTTTAQENSCVVHLLITMRRVDKQHCAAIKLITNVKVIAVQITSMRQDNSRCVQAAVVLGLARRSICVEARFARNVRACDDDHTRQSKKTQV